VFNRIGAQHLFIVHPDGVIEIESDREGGY
jgi:hypothetical protein